jgi:GxxExxY protein
MTEETTRAKLVLLHGERTGGIIGAFFDAYNELGFGFFEAVYQRALPFALAARGIDCPREVSLTGR